MGGGAHTLLHRDFHFRREDMAKRKWKVENDGSAFLHFFLFVQTYFAISRAVGFRFFNVFISLDSSFHQLSNAVFEIVLLQKLAKI